MDMAELSLSGSVAESYLPATGDATPIAQESGDGLQVGKIRL
jgi:hypothetical protein